MTPPNGHHAAGYTRHDGAVLSRAEREGPCLALTLGFDETAFRTDRPRPALVILALDGSAAMEAAWAPGGQGVCLMTELVSGVLRRLHQAEGPGCDLVCAFLSSDEVVPVGPGTAADAVESSLQQVRREAGLRFRGAFLLPTAERLAARFRGRARRLCVVSDGPVFDYEDVEQSAFSSRAWYALGAGDPPGAVVLAGEKGGLSARALDEHFAAAQDAFRAVAVRVEGSFPLAWEPAGGRLVRAGGGLELGFAVADERTFRARLRLPSWASPREVAVRGTVVRRGAPADFALVEVAAPGRCPPLPTRRGSLTDEEFDRWRQFETPRWRCPLCGAAHPRLLETPPMGLRERPVFASLAGQPGTSFLLEAGRREWFGFETGLEVGGGAAVVLIEGVPHAALPGAPPEPLPRQDSHYRLEHEGRRWFVVPA